MEPMLGWLETFLQALSVGLTVGCCYGLMCAALGLIFGVMRVINFAQGDFLMLGMYFVFYVVTGTSVGLYFGMFGAALIVTIIALPVFFALGCALHRVLVSRVSGMRTANSSDDGHQSQLILTLGISLILQNGGLMAFGSTPVSVKTPLSSQAWELGPFVGDAVTVFINQGRFVGAIVSVILTYVLHLIFTRTDTGKILRAAADNSTSATYVGIDVDKAHRIAFGIGIALTAAAGGLIATYYPFQPYVGLEFVIIMYAGVVLGGMGSVSGAFWGGLVIGLVQQLSTLVVPVQLQSTAIFVVFLLVLVLRPQGLFGRNVERA